MRSLYAILILAGLAVFATPAFSQQKQIYCVVSTLTPCDTSIPHGTGTQGDVIWLANGKDNFNFDLLFGMFGGSSSLKTTGVLTWADVMTLCTGTKDSSHACAGDGTMQTLGGGGGGTPGGSSAQSQYNNSGVFGGYTTGGDCTQVTSTGVITCKGSRTQFAAVSSTTTLSATNTSVVVSGATTITLPTAVGEVHQYCVTVAAGSTSIVSIATTSSQTIQAVAAPATISGAGNGVCFNSDNSNWWY